MAQHPDAPGTSPGAPPGTLPGRPARSLARKIAVTRAALAVEALWPPVAAALCITGLYLAATLAGVWSFLPGIVHWLAFAAALAGAAAVLGLGVRRFRPPTRHDALRAIERRAGLRHRPLTSLEDARAGFTGPRDAGAELWELHRARLATATDAARAVAPRSALPRLDPVAARAAIGLLLVAALVAAGRDAPARLAEGLLPGLVSGPGTAIAFDAWITPPAYTNVPPLFLNRLPPGSDGTPPAITVPEGSVLTARVHGASSAAVRLGDDSTGFTRTPNAASGSSTHDLDLPLATGGLLVLTADGRSLVEADVTVTPDTPPEITFAEDQALSVSTTLSLVVSFDLFDDYGVTSAKMGLALPGQDAAGGDQSGDGPALAGATPLVSFRLPLPSSRVTEAEDEVAYFELTRHPWAGLQVEITLAALDDAGQEGTSETRIMRLPERNFADPVARAVIEQRQRLASEPDAVESVTRALGGLTLHAERFYDTATDYLPLRAAYWRLRNADRPEDVAGIYDLLWDVALHFEDGGLSLAGAALRDAQDALMEALARGAGPDELDRLMTDLRQAMDEFLSALGQQQMQAGQQGQMAPMSPDMQEIQEGDLRDMLDRLQDLAQSGSRDAARQLLSQLRSILENLTAGIPGQMQMTAPQSAMNDAIDGLGELMDRQRTLQDETVRQESAEPGAGMEGEGAGSSGGGQGGDLAQRQQDLRNRLGELRQGLEGSGVPAPSAMGRAERAMRDAERALSGNDPGRAARRQGEAIESLRDTAQSLAESLLEDLAQSGQQGQDRGRGGEGRDPLGRPQRTAGPQQGDGVEVPDESDIQRARRILEELQRRSGDRARPSIELDYLNRLMQRF